MSLEALVLGAMLQKNAAGEIRPTERERLEPVAASIVAETAVVDLFEGPQRAEATALLLVAIGRHESGFLEEVRRCRRSGDNGRSIGLYQLMGPWAWAGQKRNDICADDALQARLALRVLGIYRSTCGASTRTLLQAYASGTCRRPTTAARAIEDTFFRLLRERHIVVQGKKATSRPGG